MRQDCDARVVSQEGGARRKDKISELKKLDAYLDVFKFEFVVESERNAKPFLKKRFCTPKNFKNWYSLKYLCYFLFKESGWLLTDKLIFEDLFAC